MTINNPPAEWTYSIDGINFQSASTFDLLSSGEYQLYAQDEWQVNEKFKLTYGVRMDMPLYFDTKTKVEELLSAHVGGTDVTLHLYGNVSFKLTGMTMTLNTTLDRDVILAGVSGDLIDEIKMESLSIVLGGPTANANMVAYVNNPFSFSVDVSRMDYDVWRNLDP